MFKSKYIPDLNDNYLVHVDYEIKAISNASQEILKQILDENPRIKNILKTSADVEHAKKKLRSWVMEYLQTRPEALDYYNCDITGREYYDKLIWKDFAAIRILDYINHEGKEYEDLNLRGKYVLNNPVKLLWLAVREGNGGAEPAFFRDMLYLLRQFTGKTERKMPSKKQVKKWMDRHPSGLDSEIIEIRKKNRDRIIRILIEKIDNGDIIRHKYEFKPGMTFEQKYEQMMEWWNDKTFHLQFAVRSPELLNKLL